MQFQKKTSTIHSGIKYFLTGYLLRYMVLSNGGHGMNEKESTKKALPPYVPYRTFTNFLENLKHIGVPQVIDRSIAPFKSMSGALQGQVRLALEYLHLINEDGETTEGLKHLVNTEEGVEREQALKDVLIPAYSFIFENGLNLENATHRQLEERFKQEGATGDTPRKCIAFFLHAARGAGIKLSPHFKKVRGPRKATAKPRRKEAEIPKAKSSPPAEEAKSIHTKTIQQGGADSWENILLDKFPKFDPAWPDEVKSKWFDDFKALMELKKRG
jgi:hypothetical protein